MPPPPRFTKYKVLHGNIEAPYSPVSARVYLKTSTPNRSSEITPKASMVRSPRAMVFQSRKPPIQYGDIIDLKDGTYGRIVNIRNYQFSVQADLNVIPYTLGGHVWTPSKAVAQKDPVTLNLKDVAYSSAGKILCYIEPMNDMDKATSFGRLDVRSRRIYSVQPLVMGSIVCDASGDAWICTTPSDEWPDTGDLRAQAVHLTIPPVGVTF